MKTVIEMIIAAVFGAVIGGALGIHKGGMKGMILGLAGGFIVGFVAYKPKTSLEMAKKATEYLLHYFEAGEKCAVLKDKMKNLVSYIIFLLSCFSISLLITVDCFLFWKEQVGGVKPIMTFIFICPIVVTFVIFINRNRKHGSDDDISEFGWVSRLINFEFWKETSMWCDDYVDALIEGRFDKTMSYKERPILSGVKFGFSSWFIFFLSLAVCLEMLFCAVSVFIGGVCSVVNGLFCVIIKISDINNKLICGSAAAVGSLLIVLCNSYLVGGLAAVIMIPILLIIKSTIYSHKVAIDGLLTGFKYFIEHLLHPIRGRTSVDC